MRGVFREEPRHVDLSWARTDTDLTLRNARFRDLVAEIAAPLHGRSKDDLEGEDVRQQRRTRRLVRGAVGALAALTVLASVGGASAIVNAREAGRQRDTARDQARLATAANLADQSAAADRSDLSLKILLAVQSYRLAPTKANEAVLRAALLTDATGVLHGPTGGVVDLAIAPDGKQAAAVDGTGAVHVWDIASRTLERSSAAGVGTRVDWLGPSSLLVGHASGGVASFDIADGTLRPLADGVRVLTDPVTGLARPVLAASPASGYIAYLRIDGTVAVLEADGTDLYSLPTSKRPIYDLVLTSDGRLVAKTSGIDIWELGPAGATPVAAAADLYPRSDDPVRLHGGLALSLDEARVAWAASDEYDAVSGERLSHRQCISMADPFLPSAATYVGGTDSPVYWDIGFGVGFATGLSSGAGVPGRSCAPNETNLNIQTTPPEVAAGFAVPGGVVWSLAGRTDGLLLAGGTSGPVIMVRFGAYSTRTDLAIGDLLGVACLVAGRNLTASEWAAYLPGGEPGPICAAWPPLAGEVPSPFAD